MNLSSVTGCLMAGHSSSSSSSMVQISRRARGSTHAPESVGKRGWEMVDSGVKWPLMGPLMGDFVASN